MMKQKTKKMQKKRRIKMKRKAYAGASW